MTAMTCHFISVLTSSRSSSSCRSCACCCYMWAAALLLQSRANEQPQWSSTEGALLKSTWRNRGDLWIHEAAGKKWSRKANRPPSDHKVTSLTVGPLCHMEKYSARDLNVNTSLVSFCSGQAFNRNSSCASSPLGPGKRKDIIQIIKSVRRGWRIVRNTANITQLWNCFLIESVSVPSSGYYTHLTLCSG